jgi:hypothetical protein
LNFERALADTTAESKTSVKDANRGEVCFVGHFSVPYGARDAGESSVANAICRREINRSRSAFSAWSGCQYDPALAKNKTTTVPARIAAKRLAIALLRLRIILYQPIDVAQFGVVEPDIRSTAASFRNSPRGW